MDLNEIQNRCYNQSKSMGWWYDIHVLKTENRKVLEDPHKVFGSKIALCHSELSEALEGARKGLMDDHLPNREMAEVELADCIIRILDLAGAMGYDMNAAVLEKLDYNLSRADHDIKNRMAEGGKKF